MDGSPAQVPCPHCGWSPGPREVICASCSALLGRRGEPIYAAGRARRIFSHIVDNAVQLIPVLLIGQIVQRDLDSGLLTAISVGLWFIVIAALAGRAQSPGKIMLGTRIRMADGSRPSRQRVILREFLWWLLLSLPIYLSVAFWTIPGEAGEPPTVETQGQWLIFLAFSLLLVDALAMLVSPSRRALHDRVFGTMIERVVPGWTPSHAPHMPDRDPRDPPPAPPEAGLPEAREAPPPPPRRPPPPPLPEGAQAALDELDRSRPHLTQSQYERRRRQILAEHGIDADA